MCKKVPVLCVLCEELVVDLVWPSSWLAGYVMSLISFLLIQFSVFVLKYYHQT